MPVLTLIFLCFRSSSSSVIIMCLRNRKISGNKDDDHRLLMFLPLTSTILFIYFSSVDSLDQFVFSSDPAPTITFVYGNVKIDFF